MEVEQKHIEVEQKHMEVEQKHIMVTGWYAASEREVRRVYMARLCRRVIMKDWCQVFFLCQLSLKHL